MKQDARHQRILTIITAQGQTSVTKLATSLGVSKETIRRDLAKLEQKGFIRKVHGGATATQTASESAVSIRLLAQRYEKERIASYAAGLFNPGDSIFIDAGTTTISFAAAVAQVSGITAITNCIQVAHQLWSADAANRVYLLGGEYRGEIGQVLGSMTLNEIRKFRADHAVLTVGALHADVGVMDFNVDEAAIGRAMMRQAGQTTVLADHTKLGRSALVKVCGLEDVSRLVTDRKPQSPMADALTRSGTDVHIAGLAAGLSRA